MPEEGTTPNIQAMHDRSLVDTFNDQQSTIEEQERVFERGEMSLKIEELINIAEMGAESRWAYEDRKKRVEERFGRGRLGKLNAYLSGADFRVSQEGKQEGKEVADEDREMDWREELKRKGKKVLIKSAISGGIVLACTGLLASGVAAPLALGAFGGGVLGRALFEGGRVALGGERKRRGELEKHYDQYYNQVSEYAKDLLSHFRELSTSYENVDEYDPLEDERFINGEGEGGVSYLGLIDLMHHESLRRVGHEDEESLTLSGEEDRVRELEIRNEKLAGVASLLGGLGGGLAEWLLRGRELVAEKAGEAGQAVAERLHDAFNNGAQSIKIDLDGDGIAHSVSRALDSAKDRVGDSFVYFKEQTSGIAADVYSKAGDYIDALGNHFHALAEGGTGQAGADKINAALEVAKAQIAESESARVAAEIVGNTIKNALAMGAGLLGMELVRPAVDKARNPNETAKDAREEGLELGKKDFTDKLPEPVVRKTTSEQQSGLVDGFKEQTKQITPETAEIMESWDYKFENVSLEDIKLGVLLVAVENFNIDSESGTLEVNKQDSFRCSGSTDLYGPILEHIRTGRKFYAKDIVASIAKLKVAKKKGEAQTGVEKRLDTMVEGGKDTGNDEEKAKEVNNYNNLGSEKDGARGKGDGLPPDDEKPAGKGGIKKEDEPKTEPEGLKKAGGTEDKKEPVGFNEVVRLIESYLRPGQVWKVSEGEETIIKIPIEGGKGIEIKAEDRYKIINIDENNNRLIVEKASDDNTFSPLSVPMFSFLRFMRPDAKKENITEEEKGEYEKYFNIWLKQKERRTAKIQAEAAKKNGVVEESEDLVPKKERLDTIGSLEEKYKEEIKKGGLWTLKNTEIDNDIVVNDEIYFRRADGVLRRTSHAVLTGDNFEIQNYDEGNKLIGFLRKDKGREGSLPYCMYLDDFVRYFQPRREKNLTDSDKNDMDTSQEDEQTQEGKTFKFNLGGSEVELKVGMKWINDEGVASTVEIVDIEEDETNGKVVIRCVSEDISYELTTNNKNNLRQNLQKIFEGGHFE